MLTTGGVPVACFGAAFPRTGHSPGPTASLAA